MPTSKSCKRASTYLQENILFDKLTAREHLKVFGTIRDIPDDKMNDEINQRLEELGLTENANERTEGFSGGMKRKLSVAISLIGSPKVIVLDERKT